MPPSLSHLILDERLRRFRFASALLLFALIVILGSIPGARQEIGTMASGLILHSLAYSVLTLLLFTGGTGSRTGRALKALALVALMGAIDELVQSQLPYRHGAVQDWMVDITSSMITAALLWAFLPAPAAVRQA